MKKSFQFILICLFLSLMNIILMGQEVDLKTVEKVSLNVHSLLIATEEKEVKISKIIPISKEESSLGYIINFDDNSFLIISGDYAIEPVLGYCNKNDFSYANVPPRVIIFIETI